jgi:hypothetical protein
MRRLKTAFIGMVFGAFALASAPASAIPTIDLGLASKSFATQTQKVVWVCGRYRCWRRPVFVYPAPYVSYRPYVAYWGAPQLDWGWRRWYW